MSSMGDTMIGLGQSIPETVRQRALAEAAKKRQAEKDAQEAEQYDMVKKDWLVKRATADAENKRTGEARGAIDTFNTDWQSGINKQVADTTDTADLAKEQAVTADYGKLRGLPADQARAGLGALESGPGEAARADSLANAPKLPGEVDRFRSMSQKLTPYSGIKEVDTALGNAKDTATMEQQVADRQAAREAAEAKADEDRKLRAEMAAERMAFLKANALNKDTKQDFSQEASLAKDFHGMSKDFIQIRNSYKDIESIYDKQSKNPTGPDDVAFIYKIAKMYDPMGVVREADYDAVAKSGSVPQNVKTSLQKAINGQKLDDGMRKNYYENAKMLYGNAHESWKGTKDYYDNRASSYGLDPEKVTGGLDYEGRSDANTGGGSGNAGQKAPGRKTESLAPAASTIKSKSGKVYFF